MIYSNSIGVELFIKNQIVDIHPSDMSFQITNSIRSPLPEVTFVFEDATGDIYDGFLFLPGTPITVSFGIQNLGNITCPFMVDSADFIDVSTSYHLAGDLQVSCSHLWKKSQEIKCGSYTNRISSIVRQLATKFPFKTLNIQETSNYDTWYQAARNDVTFIDHLTYRSLAATATKSPFYFWIDSNNSFNFTDYQSLISQNPVDTLTAVPKTAQSIDGTNIVSYIPLLGGDYVRDLTNRKYYYQDEETGEFIVKSDSLTDYPVEQVRPIPTEKTSLITNKTWLGRYENTTFDSNDKQAYLVNSMRQSLSPMKLLITTPLNIKLLAGKQVNVKIPTIESNDKFSNALSGNYIIESSSFVWEGGKTNRAFTQCVLTRRTVDLPSTYYRKKDMING